MNETILSNTLADLAKRIREVNTKAEEAAETVIERTLQCGALLVDAKEQCRHGESAAFLKRAGINERYAQRCMKLARSGLEKRHVSDLGSVRAALDYLDEPQRRRAARCCTCSTGKLTCFISPWSGRRPSHPAISTIGLLESAGRRGEASQTIRPMSCKRVDCDGRSVNVLWFALAFAMGLPAVTKTDVLGTVTVGEQQHRLEADAEEAHYRHMAGAELWAKELAASK